MESRNTYHPESGFTILEILIVLALSSILGASAVNLSLLVMQRQFFHSDVETVVRFLNSARNQSINNINGKAHGVMIGAGKVTLFSGNHYDPLENSNIITATKIHPLSNNSYEIAFTPFTGASTNPLSIALTDDHNTTTLSISSSGAIND